MEYIVYLLKYSGSANKKYTVVIFLNDKKIKTIHFGQNGASDYTLHKDSLRMREYVRRHGGVISKTLMSEDNETKVHNKMNSVIKSTKEKWTITGITTAGFWSRWLLWSEPSLKGAINLIENKFDISIKRGSPPS